MNGCIADGRFAAASVQQAQKAQATGQMFALSGAFLIDWISDTSFPGYTDVQGLIKCLEYKMTVCSQAGLW